MTHYFLIKSDNEDIIVTTHDTKSTFIKTFRDSNLKYNSIIELSPGEFFKIVEDNSCFLISIN